MSKNADWLGLGGRVCVVTGAGSGIGRAVAAAMIGAGAVTALLDRNRAASEAVAAELRRQDGTAVAIECDTSDSASVHAAAEEVQRAFGRCDVLINNAGLLRSGPLESLSLEDWNHLLSVNLTGYLLCAQAFGKPMHAAKRGSIVHVASVAAHHPQPRSGAYSASKAGVAILSRQLALEWGPSGIRSNVVSPGLIRTPLSEAFYQAPGVSERRAQVVPSRRIGTPEDIADVVLYLASDRAAYVNGADVAVDGGFAAVLMDTVPRPGF
ncbi:MAG TPA: SDR family NAD(P)-dependent oxidoreductase [Stellaceae bacterium]|nr:SDR family NAD(P)-dependent oxidoreductase [Stellaceae bacterium]